VAAINDVKRIIRMLNAGDVHLFVGGQQQVGRKITGADLSAKPPLKARLA